MQYVPLDCSHTQVSKAVIDSLALRQGQSIGNHTLHLSCHWKFVPLWWHHSMETLSAFLAPLLPGHNKMVCLYHSMYYIKSTVKSLHGCHGLSNYQQPDHFCQQFVQANNKENITTGHHCILCGATLAFQWHLPLLWHEWPCGPPSCNPCLRRTWWNLPHTYQA